MSFFVDIYGKSPSDSLLDISKDNWRLSQSSAHLNIFQVVTLMRPCMLCKRRTVLVLVMSTAVRMCRWKAERGTRNAERAVNIKSVPCTTKDGKTVVTSWRNGGGNKSMDGKEASGYCPRNCGWSKTRPTLQYFSSHSIMNSHYCRQSVTQLHTRILSTRKHW
jgi:hypothetical protein